jgi:tRNA pseudouridine13 synthase
MDTSITDPPYLTSDLPGVGGSLKAEADDFRVDEIPAYPPSGEGTHLFVRFEKRDLDTPRAVDAIARALGVDPRATGFAGLKDRRAITTQWASFEGASAETALAISLPGIRILDAALHPHKLRTGHLSANRFALRIESITGDLDAARRILECLEARGCPNYFGTQRFGRGGENLARARRWIVDGARPPRKRFDKKLLVSTFQAALFNEYLKERVEDGLLDRCIEGDLLKKTETGGMFVSESLAEDDPRVASFEVSPTGPMFGIKMRWPKGAALVRETAVLDRAGLSPADLARFKKAGEGTRRVIRVRPRAVSARVEDGDLHLAFDLDKGAYATVIAREIMKGPKTVGASVTND